MGDNTTTTYASADALIREWMEKGNRDDEQITAALMGYPELLHPVVIAYVRNRLRGWGRAIVDYAGRDEAAAASLAEDRLPPRPRHRVLTPAPLSPLQGRQKVLDEVLVLQGHKPPVIPWPEVTHEHLQYAIGQLEAKKDGMSKSIVWFQHVDAWMSHFQASRYGDLDLSQVDFSRFPPGWSS